MAFDPWAGTNQGLSSVGNTIMSLSQLRRQDAEDAQRSKLADLQTQAAQQSVDQNKITLADLGARQGALIDQYGTAQHSDPLASAYSFQAQQEQEAEQQKAARDKQKYAFDEYMKVAKAVDEGLLDESQATSFYSQAMKLAGNDLDSAGVKLEFKKQKGGYYTGPVNPKSLFMINGQPAEYGAAGVVSKARVVGRDEQTGLPILEMDENTTFAESKPEKPVETWSEPYEAVIGGKRAMMQKSNRGQVRSVLADNSTTVKINTGGGKPTNTGGTGHGAKPSGGKPLPAGTLADLNEASQMLKTLKEAQQAAGTVNTGPVAGRLQSLGQSVGLASDDFTQLKQKIATVNNAMLKLRSGAAVTESEYQRFLQEMPTANDTETVRDAKFNNAITYMENLLDGKVSTFAEGGYRVPTGLGERSQPKVVGSVQKQGAPKQSQTKKSGGYSDLLNKYKR